MIKLPASPNPFNNSNMTPDDLIKSQKSDLF
jgi:hypothetical protein